MVILLSALKSMHILQVPSFFGISTIGDPHGDTLSLMTPWSSNSWIYLLISSFSTMDILYNPRLGKGESGTNWMSCSMVLLGGRPFGSLKTTSCFFSSRSSWSFCSTINADFDDSASVFSSFIGRTTNITNFLLPLISRLAWLAEINEIFSFPR